MFDNPRKKLHWMEEELLAEESGPEEEVYDEIYEDFGQEFQELDEDGQFLAELNQLLEEDEEEEEMIRPRGRRNDAVNFRRTAYADEEADGTTALLVEKRSRKKGEKKKKGIKGLVILACLEVLGILAVIGWWLQWLI